ncbi:ubiquitin carboxyl-terminal hydrolase 2 [Humulus lupulus]|uniref:ubiquitin carboxyl-terminal hydrolase 2 n=1 Tax=Humulus lupulus TaxID=3486 RepID=UPI002B40D127|nr:ubiquitin carboxyl-terminal hydrolase 2 [Humulus lupulus]XP_062109198.1 ubiquitin carboxyl-terminal hydrolase 2 [Humulus lupulus]XP_062109199.1 ubiquitin carboxyl-terminal hydrolase 2 [Humulus lupulus]
MGKKVKKKSRTPQKEKKVTINSQKNVSQPSEQSAENVDSAATVVRESKPCPHLGKGINLDKLSAKIGLAEPVRCEDCREGAVDRRASKGKAKHGKKKGGSSADSKSDSKATWICLECGHYACGGVGLPTNPQCHALRHTRQTRHPLVIQFEKPQLRWCFPCNTLVPAEKIEENGEQKDAFSDVVKLIKGHTTEGAAVNVENVWFGSGSVTTEIKSIAVSGDLDGQGGYVVRGLVNLGNTCFFNSVLQNLIAMDKLRDFFFKLEASVGPLTIALKKIYNETKPEAGFKNVINPRAFFGSLCSKAPQFRGYQQHDSHELLRCLLDGLSSEELGVRKQSNSSKENGHSSSPGPTFVDAVFGGQVSSTVCCTECGHSSTVYEPFLDLSLPVPTKKPTSKKAQQFSRTKKAKLPPKRGGKPRPKVSRGPDLISDASTSKELSCQPQSGTAGPTTLAEENSSVGQNSSAVEQSGNKQVVEDAAEQTSAAIDIFSWLDYLEPEAPLDDYNMTSNDFVGPTLQDSENKDTFINAEPGQSGFESSALVLPLSEEPDTKAQFSNVNPWEDEIPVQVQSSQVLLLPYKEEDSTAVEFEVGEGSSSVFAGVQEDFEGFGGLFDEPEVSAGPFIGPSLGNDVAKTGFVASSESDPDEVDDSDSPVSVETCLVHYTKPELLSYENAWHCENCSKALVRQKLVSHKQLNSAPKALVNGCGTAIQSDIEYSNKDPCPKEARQHDDNSQCVSNLNKFDATIDCSSQKHTKKENGHADELASLVTQTGEGKVVMKYAQEQSGSSGSFHTCKQESLIGQAIDSCCVDEASSAGSIGNKVQQSESKISAPNPETEENGDDELNSESVKVKRDATKRVLINKAPPILTIHLKRFSQDARGRLSKLNGHVTFREIIDLKPYMDASCTDEGRYDFRLIGVVEHQGSMRGGHYIAYVRGHENSSKGKENGGSVWFHASDAYVRQTSLDEVLRSEAYILFYERL